MKKQVGIVGALLATGALVIAFHGHGDAQAAGQPPFTTGTADGQAFGGAGITLQPTTASPVLSESEALTDAWEHDPWGDKQTSALAILGMATPNPGLGMLAKPTLVWAIVYDNACIPVLGPGGGPPQCGAKGAVFVNATSGEILGSEAPVG